MKLDKYCLDHKKIINLKEIEDNFKIKIYFERDIKKIKCYYPKDSLIQFMTKKNFNCSINNENNRKKNHYIN